MQYTRHLFSNFTKASQLGFKAIKSLFNGSTMLMRLFGGYDQFAPAICRVWKSLDPSIAFEPGERGSNCRRLNAATLNDCFL